MRLSLVVPCFNEQNSVAVFHETVVKELVGTEGVTGLEIVFVDDGSTDGTLDELRLLAERDRRVRYVGLSRNFGKEAAMLAGLAQSTGDAVVLMDADLQHPPSIIPGMLDLFRAGHDQVVARRTRDGDPRFRSMASRLYYRLANRCVDVELLDGVGDFRLLSRTAVQALLELSERNRFAKGLYAWIGFNTAVIPYRNVARVHGETTWSIRKLVNYGFDGLISFNNRPLRTAIHLGLALAGLACAHALWIIATALLYGVQTPGYVTILVAVMGLGGVQMFMMGVIGEYVGRIYYETKRRPHYLIREQSLKPSAIDGEVSGDRVGYLAAKLPEHV